MEQHIKKTKIYFSCAVFLLAAVLVTGAYTFKDNDDFSFRETQRVLSYFYFKVDFSKFSGKYHSVADTIRSLFQGKTSVAEELPFTPAQSIPVLVYHGIVPVSDPFSMTQETFRDQMFTLKKAGYETITVEDLVSFVRGEKDLPDKSFVLTFDDGRKDSFYGADPIIQALDYSAIMFTVVTDSLPTTATKVSSYYLNQGELQKMIKSGHWQIESHGIQYGGGFVPINALGKPAQFLSSKAWLSSKNRLETEEEFSARINDELVGSKKIIEEKFGITVNAFAYPFGDFGQQSKNFPKSTDIINAAVRQNYAVAFYQVWPRDHGFSQNHVYDDGAYLRRLEPSPEWEGKTLLHEVEKGRAKDLPYTDTFSENNGWKKSWGELSLKDSQLFTSSATTTSGSFIFLDGSYLWHNYVFKAEMDWVRGSHVSLVADFKDDANYTTCIFSDTSTRIEERINGYSTIVTEVKNKVPLNKNNVELEIDLSPGIVRCLANGASLASGSYVSPLHGGIGLKTWDTKNGNSFVILKKVAVEAVSNR